MNFLLEGRGDHIDIKVKSLEDLKGLSYVLSSYEYVLGQKPESNAATLQKVRDLREHIVDDVIETHEGKLPPNKIYEYSVQEENLILDALSASLARDEEVFGAENQTMPESSSPQADGQYKWLYDRNIPIKVGKAARFITYESDQIAKEYNFDK